ncbi:MAG: RNA polymerase sigma factor [Flavobacteriales bacterium]|nr:RNA polymerase sigma factor [Flavobacteriales bacterium]
MMKGICLRYAKDEMEAEDILQESFIQAFRNLDKYSAKGPLGAWMRRITINKALEQYRKNKSLNELAAFAGTEGTAPLADDGAIEQLNLDDLLVKIQNLPTGFRTVFNLYAVEGYTHKEIGELLGISEGTSKSQYSRARVLLRKMIEEEEQNERSNLEYAKQRT